MKIGNIIVSENGFNSAEPCDIIGSNITFLNVLKAEGVARKEILEDAWMSYYVDFYLAQYNNGNFPQFVWNSGWNPEQNEVIRKGLQKMGAVKHLALFDLQSAKVESLSPAELQRFMQSDYFGENATRDALKNNDFYNLEEDLALLNANWLRSHPLLKVLPVEAMYVEIENIVGRSIQR